VIRLEGRLEQDSICGQSQKRLLNNRLQWDMMEVTERLSRGLSVPPCGTAYQPTGLQLS
jgi:hypothetical protein